MLRCRMQVLEDEASRQMMWRNGDTMYYPQGMNDPDYCVLKFTAVDGGYYSDFHSEVFNIDELFNK